MSRLALYILIAVLSICIIQAPASAQDTTAPVIGSIVISPDIAAAKDILHVVVSVTDDTGVTSVTADQIVLSATTGSNWEGDIPANPALGEHTVSITAEDAAGNSTAISDMYYRTVPIMGLNNQSALDPIINNACSDYLFRVWGKARFIDENTFSVSDGSRFPITVIAPEHTVANDDYVLARGILDIQNAPPATLRSAQYSILVMAPRKAITLYDVTVGKDLQTTDSGSLPTPVAYGANLKVNISSSDSTKVLLAKTPTAPGSASITLTVPGGSSTIPTFYVQGLASSGVVDVTATASGGYGKVFKVNLAPSGFVITSSNLNTTTFSGNTNVQIKPARLNPANMAYSTPQPLRAGMPALSVDVTSFNSAAGIILNSPLFFNPNVDYLYAQFDPISSGTTTLSIITPAGFSTPSNYQSITATVSAPDIVTYDANVGKDLQLDTSFYLAATPPAPVDVTISVADPSVAVICKDKSLAGSGSITFSGVSSTSSQTFYVQGLSTGTTTLAVSAEGYNAATKTIKVDPSGFIIVTGSFSTTTFSANINVQMKPVRLNPTNLAYSAPQPLRAGMPAVSVDVTSSNTAVGTILNSPLVFNPNVDYLHAQFDPIGSGTTTLSINTPAGFSTPSNYQSITATVSAPNITAYDTNVGKNLQLDTSFYLAAAPPAPVDVTVSVADPSVAIICKDKSLAGSGSITFSGVNSTSSQTFYVQGLSTGTTTLTVNAEGYNTATKTVKVDPSGFAIMTGNFSTTSFSGNTNVQIRPVRLNPANMAYSTPQPLRAGMPAVSVDVTSSNSAAGTILNSPLIFNPNVNNLYVQFDPIGAGTTTLAIITPAGFSTPSNYQSITATVNVPDIVAYDTTVGRDLQVNTSCYLAVAPPAPVDVTVTVEDPAIAVVSTNSSTAGSGSITYSSVSSTSSMSYIVQGLRIGSTKITVSAPGYNAVEKTITVDPSGFIIYSPSSISTTASAGNNNLVIRPARLNPTNLTYITSQELRGGTGPISVYVTSSNSGVGVITTSPITFSGGVISNSTQFDPIAAGTTDIAVEAPVGFSVPTTSRVITATVN